MCYSEMCNDFGVTKMLKGSQLNFGDTFKNNKSNYWSSNDSRRFEVRINLNKLIFQIGSLPNYELVAELDDKK